MLQCRPNSGGVDGSDAGVWASVANLGGGLVLDPPDGRRVEYAVRVSGGRGVAGVSSAGARYEECGGRSGSGYAVAGAVICGIVFWPYLQE